MTEKKRGPSQFLQFEPRRREKTFRLKFARWLSRLERIEAVERFFNEEPDKRIVAEKSRRLPTRFKRLLARMGSAIDIRQRQELNRQMSRVLPEKKARSISQQLHKLGQRWRARHISAQVRRLSALEPLAQVEVIYASIKPSNTSFDDILEQIEDAYYAGHPELPGVQQQSRADATAKAYILHQAGCNLASDIADIPAHEFLWEDVLCHLGAVRIDGADAPAPKVQRFLSKSVKELLAENIRHAPQRIARFIGWLLRPTNAARIQTASHDIDLRWELLRGRLKLGDGAEATERLRRFDAIAMAVVGRAELFGALHQLRSECGKEKFEKSLTSCLRHIGAQASPSLQASIKDIEALHARKIAREGAGSAKAEDDYVEKTVVAFHRRSGRTFGRKLPKEFRDMNSDSFAATRRRAKSELRRRFRIPS